MKESLNIYKEEDIIIIQNDLINIELPYTDELWRKLDGEKTYDEDSGWFIDGIELNTIIEDESDKETENVFVGTIQVDGIDERRELYVVKEGDIYKIIGIDPDEEVIDIDIISDNLQEAILKTQETWGDEESDLQLSVEADKIIEEAGEAEK
jgi:hypothetical protein